jgi:hypothetical protein
MSYTNTPRFLLHQFYEIYLRVNPNDIEKKVELEEIRIEKAEAFEDALELKKQFYNIVNLYF